MGDNREWQDGMPTKNRGDADNADSASPTIASAMQPANCQGKKWNCLDHDLGTCPLIQASFSTITILNGKPCLTSRTPIVPF